MFFFSPHASDGDLDPCREQPPAPSWDLKLEAPEKKCARFPHARCCVERRFDPDLVLGPPGCGKTRWLLDRFTHELHAGVQPERIALVTFTRAARAVALERAERQFQIPQGRLPWVRTIHSSAYRLLQLEPGRILDAERLAEFARKHGYKLTIDGRRIDDESERGLTLGRTADDRLLFAYEWGRSHGLDAPQTLSRCPVGNISVSQFKLFVRRLEGFKREFNLLDFTDLLERTLEAGLRPDVDVAMVDEAHDLSPLQIAVVESWFTPCQRAYVAADDDQAIYGWQGASPDWIRSLASRREPYVLQDSHRVPRAVHALALRIIAPNVARTPKLYRPADRDGRVVRADLDGALGIVARSDSAFVLVRNRQFIRRIAEALLERAIPYTVSGWGGSSPLDNVPAVRAVNLVLRLARSEPGPFPASHVAALLELVATSSRHVPQAARECIANMQGRGSLSRDDLCRRLALGALIEAIKEHGIGVLTVLRRNTRRYFERLVGDARELPAPTTTVTSIHVAKGDERRVVVVIPDMTRPTHQAYLRGGAERNEAENRAFYVAVTRTIETLVLVYPQTRRYFQFPRDTLGACAARVAVRDSEGGAQ